MTASPRPLLWVLTATARTYRPRGYAHKEWRVRELRMVFRFRSRNALTPVEVIDLPAWVSMSLSYTILSAKALKGKCRMPRKY